MKLVLFVCVGNAGRSQMAEAFFNHLAQGKAQAISAGTSPAQEIDPKVVQLMQEVDIDVSHHKPKLLTSDMLNQADLIVTMGCGVEDLCPATFAETQDWGLNDPKGKPIDEIRKIRDEIRTKVIKLIEEM